MTLPQSAYPAWIAWPVTVLVAVLVPVYWHSYGPVHFLWFSDLALFAVLISVWTGNRLLFSMAAVAVLPLEIYWSLDFLSGARLGGGTAYMFDDTIPRHLRALSLFHLLLPPILIWMLLAQGYDRRALPAQTALAWLVLPASRLLTEPENNINWTYGLGTEGLTIVPSGLYLPLLMIVLPAGVYLPTHLVLARLFGDRAGPPPGEAR